MAHPWFSNINWYAIYNKVVPPPYKPQLDNPASTKHFSDEFTQMRMTPQEMGSLAEDSGKWNDFSYKDNELGTGGDNGEIMREDRGYSFNE